METYKFIILNGKDFSSEEEVYYLNAYNTFHSVWLNTFRELFGPDYYFFSNDFTRQDRIHALFDGSTCVGLTCLRKSRYNNPVHLYDSWFKAWREIDIKSSQTPHEDTFLINSYFTMHPDYRKTMFQNSIHISSMLGALSVLDQLDLNISSMLGMMRNDRSMHKLGEFWGSETIQSKIEHNGIPTDLVVFRRENIKKAMENFPKIVFNIWDSRIDFSNINKKGKYEKRERAA